MVDPRLTGQRAPGWSIGFGAALGGRGGLDRSSAGAPALAVKGLHVFYGHSHALQGVDLTLQNGVLAVVGRNGMGKTTLCKAIMGLQHASGGTISVRGRELLGLAPAEIARLGIGYVPQGRRLWPSLTVDEHLRLAARPGGNWSIDRIYSTFPRLAERRQNGGGQLSGGEQQMLAISRALLTNPSLLVMDEPTEGLAPVIVDQVAEMLITLGREGSVDVLLIEQNIGVATAVSAEVAIMVNGRINRVMDAALLAADRDLQQRLLGVGRHGHDETDEAAVQGAVQGAVPGRDQAAGGTAGAETAPRRIYVSNPAPPNRWSRPVPVHVIEAAARTTTPLRPGTPAAEPQPRAAEASRVIVAGTLDTKGAELRFVRDILKEAGLPVLLVDLSTSGKPSGADVPPHRVAAEHPRGTAGVFTGDRGTSVSGMTLAFERWMARRSGVAGVISAGGSGGTALVAPAMRSLPVGVPKLIVSTVASGNVGAYVGPADITMMHSVADVQGLNSITREVLSNAAQAMAGMVHGRRAAAKVPAAPAKPAVGLTMFGVTTPAVQQVVAALEEEYDCLVFHATGTGGRSMEKLVASGKLAGVIDITTTEICDMMMGGVFAATEDRFGAMIRAGMPYVGACGALDMVNFGAPGTVPERYADRLFYEHNPQVTLMRTTAQENAAMGHWIGERLNAMEAPVRFFLPEGGVSLLDAPGQAFHDPAADAALFGALETTVRQTAARRLVRLPHNINDPEASAAIVSAFRALHGRSAQSRQAGGAA